jgi:hypothetical protein
MNDDIHQQVPGSGDAYRVISRPSEDIYQCDCIGWRQHKADLPKRTVSFLPLPLASQFYGIASHLYVYSSHNSVNI